MPDSLRRKDVKVKATKTELKQQVKHHAPVRGDRILWVRPLTGEMKRRKRGNGVDEVDGEGTEEQNPQDIPRQEEQNACEDGERELLGEQHRNRDHIWGPGGHQMKDLQQSGLWMLLLVLAGGH